MIQLISDKYPEGLAKKLNDLGPSFSIVSIYAANQLHCAWVKPDAPKLKKKDKDHEK